MPGSIEVPTVLIKRDGLKCYLDNIFYYPLTYIVAPEGYGKKTALKMFLKEHRQTIWIDLQEKNSFREDLWNVFINQVQTIDECMSDKLSQLGFPDDPFKRVELFSILDNYTKRSEVVLVINQTEERKDQVLYDLMTALAKKKYDFLHIVMIEKNISNFYIIDLHFKKLIYEITEKELRCTLEEIKYLCNVNKWAIPQNIQQEIHKLTEGWFIFALCMIKNYLCYENIKGKKEIQELAERIVLAPYSEALQGFFKILTLVPQFTVPQVIFMTKTSEGSECFFALYERTSFIKYDEIRQCYAINTVIRNILGNVYRQEQPEYTKSLLRRAAKWYLQNNEAAQAMEILLQIEAYEDILQLFFSKVYDQLLYKNSAKIINGLQGIPKQISSKYLMVYIKLCWGLCSQGKMEVMLQVIGNLVVLIQEDINDKMIKEELMEEIYFLKIVSHFRSYEEFTALNSTYIFRKNFKSKIIDNNFNFNYGGPSIVHLYYCKQGYLKERVDYLCDTLKELLIMGNGCLSGIDKLILGEYLVFIGEFDEARWSLNKALFEAKGNKQVNIQVRALFLLGKIAIYMRNSQEIEVYLKELKWLIENDEKIDKLMAQMCYDYLSLQIYQKISIKRWSSILKKGSLYLQNTGYSFAYLLIAKHYLTQKKYKALDKLCNGMLTYYTTSHYMLIRIYIYIYKSITNIYMKDKELSKVFLEKAFFIGLPDKVIAPFIENIEEIKETLQLVLQDTNWQIKAYTQLLKTVITYRHANMSISFTEREIKIIKYIAQGMKNKEIAKLLDVTEITIKKTATQIYRKLEVTSRVQAIKKIAENKLIDLK